MKFSALIATMAVVQAIDLHRNVTKSARGVDDDSYDEHYDALNKDIWTGAKKVQQNSIDGVDQIGELNAWRGTGDGWKIK